MSVTIHWRPMSEIDRHFEGGTSSELEALQETFGGSVCESDVPTLRAMAKASRSRFYDEVADVIESVGKIGFYGQY